MGRGSSSSETRVKKMRQDYSEGHSAGSGGQRQETKRDGCLFSFNTSMTIPESEAADIEKESVVVIVPHHTETDKLELFIRDRNFGSYSGPHASRIRKCIKKHYIYDGKVKSLRKTARGVRVEYSVQGRGR